MVKVLKDNEYALEGEEDFGKMFEESYRKNVGGQIKTGKIVSIRPDGVLVDVGEKSEGFLGLNEVADKDGNIPFKVGDNLQVFIFGKGERVSISYKKAKRVEKIKEKIKELGNDYQNKIIEGKITQKNKGGFVVESDEVEYFMPRAMSALKDPNKSIGKTIKVCIVDIREEENSIIVSRKKFFEINDKIQNEGVQELLKDKDKIYTGVVSGITNFGVFVEVEGIKGLVHYTEISYKGPSNPAKVYKEGDKVKCKVIGYDEEKNRLSFSIKATASDPWQEINNELKKGYTIKVVVSNIAEYGAFVDIGNGIEGFLHISEISWDKNIKSPENYLKVGQEIEVEVIEIDPQSRRLRVSLKSLSQKPFDAFVANHKVGDVIKGKIANLTDFGAFVNVGQVDGLLHNDDAFWDKDKKCKDVFKPGDEIKASISKIDKENGRISLSLKALDKSPAESFGEKNKIDSIVVGKVISVQDFGVFIEVDGMDALIRNEDLYPLKKEEIQVGQEIKGVVCLIDKQNNRVRISVKRLEKQKEKEELKAFNTESKPTLGDILKDKQK